MTDTGRDGRDTDRGAHWEKVHLEKDLSKVSWVRAEPTDSLELLAAAGLTAQTRLVDLGAGVSNLADSLVNIPIARLLLVDISVEALRLTRDRLHGVETTTTISYAVADVGRDLVAGDFDILHDRAVLHFLTDDDAKRRWLDNAERLVAPGGKLVVGTFADDGPTRCSGLDVQRYSPEQLSDFLASIARPITVTKLVHVTPGGGEQSFSYGVFERR